MRHLDGITNTTWLDIDYVDTNQDIDYMCVDCCVPVDCIPTEIIGNNTYNDPGFDYIYYIDGITLMIVAIFGIIGTIMSMIVLLKPQIRNLFSQFLTALCMFDCIFLIMAILYIALPAVSCWCSEKFSHFLHVLSGVIQTARTGSVYVTLGVTIERYFAIVHPFKCFKLKKILLPSAILFAIIYNIPKFFETETKTYGPDLYGQNYTMLCKTSLRLNPYYAQYYIFWCKAIFMELIPYITIISLNTWIVLDIFKSYKFREEHCRQKASELVRPLQKVSGSKLQEETSKKYITSKR